MEFPETVRRAAPAEITNPKPLGSVVIPAHEEGPVIERCLRALFTGIRADELEVIVVCNGCSDDTARRARQSPYPVLVLELPVASKPAALRYGDTSASFFPRLYLDADVILQGTSAADVLQRLESGAVAARPPLRYDSSGSSGLVRSYYRARSRVPAVMGSLWGAGVYGLSESGRQRFLEFPDVTADDLWVDQQFDRDEIQIVDCEPVIVSTPRTATDLIRVLRRAYRGKSSVGLDAGRASQHLTTRSAMAGLRRLLRSGPVAAFDALTYATFAVLARLVLAFQPKPVGIGGHSWERDSSSRVAL